MAAPVAAKNPDLQVSIDSKTAGIDEYFRVDVSFSAGDGVDLAVPGTDNFDVSRPSANCGTAMECRGSNCSVARQCEYVYIFSPKKMGKLVIPGFVLVDRSTGAQKTVGKSKPIKVSVIAESTGKRKKVRKAKKRGRKKPRRNQRPRARAPQLPPPTDNPISGEDLRDLEAYAAYDAFLLPSFDRNSYYLNEPFRVDLVLYVLADGTSPIAEVDPKRTEIEMADLVGFRREALETTHEQDEISISGKTYRTVGLKQFLFIPLEPGVSQMPAASIKAQGLVWSQDPFWGRRRVREIFEFHSPPVEIPIVEAPQPRPQEFNEANVGVFRLARVELPPTQPSGSWLMLKYEVEGAGNLFAVVPPVPPDSPDMNKRGIHVDRTGVEGSDEGVQGTLKVQVPIRFKRPGEYHLPVLELVYFDPAAGRFDVARAKIPPITASAPKNEDGGEARQPEGELATIVTDADLEAEYGRPGFLPLSWMLSYALGLPALYLLLLLGSTLLRFTTRDTKKRRTRLALANVRDELQSAREQLAAGKTDKLYGAISRALTTYLEARFGVSTGSTTLDRLAEQLAARGVPGPLVLEVRQELESSEFGRFAPSSLQQDDMDAALGRTRDLINRLDRCRGGDK